jgi:hypothetical protein
VLAQLLAARRSQQVINLVPSSILKENQ